MNLSTPSHTIDDTSGGVGPRFSGLGTVTRAQLVPVEPRSTNLGWGIVHFYREGQKPAQLDLSTLYSGDIGSASIDVDKEDDDNSSNDCITLCIPAVPSYLTPVDLLGFIGPKWIDHISHYRIVMTPKMNRYLVLMKARSAQQAREWRHEFNGKVFNPIEVSWLTNVVLDA